MAKKLSPARQARDREIYARSLRGASEDELRKEFRTTAQIVQRAIKAGEKAAAEEFADPARMRLKHSKQLLDIYAEAFAAWEESKKGAEVTKVSTAADGDEGKRKAEKTTRKQAGDPRFLSQAMGALQDLRQLWRLELPPLDGDANQSKHETVSLEEDARWYGNDAHNLVAQAAAAPTADPALPRPVQDRGMR